MKVFAALFLAAALTLGGGAPLSARDGHRYEKAGENDEGDFYEVTCAAGETFILEPRSGSWHILYDGKDLDTGHGDQSGAMQAAKEMCGKGAGGF